ncbi:hypothetical protein LSH36_311g03012 [Paralvinella palmiformis]|uniref:RAP domain-containing protein n=1 Tax=Paralvinella palmiformis TaxID=53620 RepID=A0AAD9N2W0_9ANNE|nr:hypothetical protein LSH36_311g03012 [Paralvinella palmiformis]
MAGLTGRCGPTLMLLRKLHWYPSSAWLSLSNSIPAVGVSPRILLHHQRRAMRFFLKPHAMMSQVSPSMCLTAKDWSLLCRELSCTSPVEFLCQLDEHSLQTCSPNDTASYIIQLGHCQMQSLMKTFPWLEGSYHTAYLQLNLSDKLEEVSQHVQDHDRFLELRRCLGQVYKECDDEYLAYSLLMLLYLGVPPQDTLIHKLLFELRSRIENMNIQTLSILSRVCKAMPQLDTITVSKSIHRLKELLQEDRQWTCDEVDYLLITATKHTRYLTFSGITDQVARILTDYVHKDDYLCEPKRIGNVVSALRKLSGHISDYSCDFLEIAVQIQVASLRHMDKLSFRDLDNICDYLHYYQSIIAPSDFQLKCEEHIMHLLENASTVRELSNLLRALNVLSSNHVLAAVESKICEKLDDVDLYLMSRIAKSFTTISPDRFSSKTMKKFQQLIAERADYMTGYWTGMQQLIGLFYKQPFLDEDVKDRFVSALMRYLKHVDYRWSETSTVLQVLVTISDYPGLPDPIFESILLGVHRWATPEVYHLINRINRAGHKLVPKFMSQVKELLIVLYSRLLELVPGVKSLYYLTPLVNKSIGSHRNQYDVDPVVLEKIMDRILFLSSDHITEYSLGRITNILLRLQYFSPILLDSMTRSALNLKTFTVKQTALALLNLLQKVGYRPVDCSDFISMMMECYDQFSQEKQYADMVCVLSYLSSLQYFPLKELKDVFSIDFLESFDKEIQGPFQHIHKNKLMTLNRNCVLECPELDVPWFHDDYCRQKYGKFFFASQQHKCQHKKWSKQLPTLNVKPALDKVLGGVEFYSVNSPSPYYYILDFECILDEKGCPVPVHLRQIKSTWQRVAILLLDPSLYCLHSRRLAGAIQIQLRHLEILGYKTVVIPHFEWNSMGLADFDAQCDYIHDKIFK